MSTPQNKHTLLSRIKPDQQEGGIHSLTCPPPRLSYKRSTCASHMPANNRGWRASQGDGVVNDRLDGSSVGPEPGFGWRRKPEVEEDIALAARRLRSRDFIWCVLRSIVK